MPPTPWSSAAASSASSPPTTSPSAGMKVALGREGTRRRRAIEPQLGLVPPAEPRRARTADGDEEPRALGALCRGDRRKHRLPALRIAVPQRRRGRAGRLGAMARFRSHRRRHHAHAERRRGERARPSDRAARGEAASFPRPTASPILPTRRPPSPRALLKLGGTVHQDCAARGIETEGGRVCGVVTEKGTIRDAESRCWRAAPGRRRSAVSSASASRRPRCARSILAVASNGEGAAGRALHRRRLASRGAAMAAIRLAISGRGRVDPTPQLLRFSHAVPADVPAALAQPRTGRDGRRPLGARRAVALATRSLRRRWSACASSIPLVDRETRAADLRARSEAHPGARRTAPSPPRGRAMSTARLTAFRGSARSRAYLASFWRRASAGTASVSGPGAGHLVADIVTGDAPIVDPRPYHPSRFADSAWGKVADF